MMDRGHELSMVSRDPETCCSTFFHFVFSSTSFRLPCVGSCLVWWPQSQTPSQAHLHPVPDLHPQQWSFAKPLHLGNRENGPFVLCLGQNALESNLSGLHECTLSIGAHVTWRVPLGLHPSWSSSVCWLCILSESGQLLCSISFGVSLVSRVAGLVLQLKLNFKK